jgi:tetratricopeptide (TPR) repeat protein
MRAKVGAAVAVGIAVLALSPGVTRASTAIFGIGYAHECSVRALLGQKDVLTLHVCTDALQDALNDGDYAKTLVNRGVVLMRRAKLDDAAKDFDQAQKYAVDLPEIYVNRGVVLMKQRQFAPAILQMDKGISLGPDEVEKAYFDRAIAKEAVGDIKGAYFDYAKAAELKPDWTAPKKEMARFNVQRPGS